MIDKNKLTQFLLKARMKAYAGGEGKVQPVFVGSIQKEYSRGNWLYRGRILFRREGFCGFGSCLL